MASKMLIDAAHPEETRVVVANGNTLEEFDFESATRKQLKGNIYLAKVTRVEPSLQAAFVEYGGNRHGFLAFSEIHPDYYQIPVADRQALIAQQREIAEAEAKAAEPADAEKEKKPGRRRRRQPAQAAEGDSTADSAPGEGETAEDNIETVSGEEIDEISRRPPIQQRYRIQEVIKRRQILLIQVTKEERGNKGAALTTYISLAGRYCVLMPNTSRGGGISRKIQSSEVRKKLRQIVSRLKVPDGMAVILRTAGQERVLSEIKRDFHYLLRLWDSIRERTLQATAPELIHEEANLIKRSIRDLYRNDIEEILVEGDDGYRIAKDFMRNLMPSRAKLVQPYKDAIPLFQRYQVEKQLDAMHSDTVQLPSGGYVVINPTEALVAIDVNSGRATRERNIEETATKTNLEAADEISRQLRLRDLAGLIVIDFIDMEENRNIRSVEKRLKDAVRIDRARIQMGRISHFGLLELSRQRLRPSLLETSSEICVACQGTGRIRSVESTALHVLRAVEEEGLKYRSASVDLIVPTSVALYILNQKRDALLALEGRYRFQVIVSADDDLVPPHYRLEQLTARDPNDAGEIPAELVAAAAALEEAESSGGKRRRRRRRRPGETADGAAEATEEAAAETQSAEAPAQEADDDNEGGSRRRRRGRRGGRRRGRGRDTRTGDGNAAAQNEQQTEQSGDTGSAPGNDTGSDTDSPGEAAGQPGGPEAEQPVATVSDAGASESPKPTAPTPEDAKSDSADAAVVTAAETAPEPAAEQAEEKPKRPRKPRIRGNGAGRPRRSRKEPAAAESADREDSDAPPRQDGNGSGDGAGDSGPDEQRTPRPEAADDQPAARPTSDTAPIGEPDESVEPRRGWWQRLTGL